jgi:hypothetical protein
MIDFVTIENEAFPLISDIDFAEATTHMEAHGITDLPVYRAYTDDLEDFNGEGLECDVIKTSLRLTAAPLNVSEFREKVWSE